MLDLMLANGNDGFSCGEVIALFRPFRPHHVNPTCGCRNPDCTIWNKATQYGEKDLYSGLFKQFQQLNFVVDSSKNLNWVFDQVRYLKKTDLQPVFILLWKEPIEFAYSSWKRGRSLGWEVRWMRYYSTFFSIMNEWISIRYSDMVSNSSETIRGLCMKIGIPYYNGKELFWSGRHHTLFGSNSAKAHLLDRESEEFSKLITKRKQAKPNVDGDQIDEF